MGLATIRRYHLFKAEQARQAQQLGLAAAFEATHRTTPGTPLPLAFPSRDKLVASGRTALEDLVQATGKELQGIGVTGKAITAVKEAHARALELRGAGMSALPEDFPERERLVALGYTTFESLTEADLTEIGKLEGITEEIVASILEALTQA